MSNPKPTLTPGLLQSLANLRPSETDKHQVAERAESKSPAPKVKASTKPARAIVSHTRSTNRGK